MEGADYGHVGIVDDAEAMRTQRKGEGIYYNRGALVICYEQGSVNEF